MFILEANLIFGSSLSTASQSCIPLNTYSSFLNISQSVKKNVCSGFLNFNLMLNFSSLWCRSSQPVKNFKPEREMSFMIHLNILEWKVISKLFIRFNFARFAWLHRIRSSFLFFSWINFLRNSFNAIKKSSWLIPVILPSIEKLESTTDKSKELLEVDAFEKHLIELLKTNKYYSYDRETLIEAFRILDTEKNGYLDLHTFYTYLRRYGIRAKKISN